MAQEWTHEQYLEAYNKGKESKEQPTADSLSTVTNFDQYKSDAAKSLKIQESEYTHQQYVQAYNKGLSNGFNSMKKPENEISWGEKLAVGSLSAFDGALDRIIKIGNVGNKILTAGANTLYSAFDTAQSTVLGTPKTNFQFQSPDIEQVREGTTLAVKKKLEEIDPTAAKLGFAGGDIGASFLIPGGALGKGLGFLGKIKEASKTGAIAGAIFGASETTTNSIPDMAENALVGAGTGALFGAAAQAGFSAIKGGIGLARNRFRNVESDKAVTSVLNDIAKGSPTASQDIVTTSQNIIKTRRNINKSVSDDLYKEAENTSVDFDMLKNKMSPELKTTYDSYYNMLLKEKSEIGNKFRRAGEPGQEKPFVRLDAIQTKIKEKIDSLTEGGKFPHEAELLLQRRKELLTHMDELSPQYQTARGLEAEAIRGAEKLTKSRIGRVSKLTEGESHKAANLIMDPQIPPKQFELLRDKYVAANKDTWNNMVRYSIEKRINNVQSQGGKPQLSDFSQAVFDTNARQSMYRSALDIPGNELIMAKMDVMAQLYNKLAKTETAIDTAANLAGDRLLVLKKLQGNKANDFNKKALDFVFNSKFNSKINQEFINLIKNKNLTRDQIISKVVDMLVSPSRRLEERLVTNAIAAPAGAVAGDISDTRNK